MRALTLSFVLYSTAWAAPKIVDYIIVGAGTSGLVIANRLSEDPSVTVIVIEPGTDQRNNLNVTDAAKYSLAFKTEIDWQYKTTKQHDADNRVLTLTQGKAWGGTSTLNGMTYIRGDEAQFNNWEKLGNKGWNYNTLLPYYKKSERYTIPNPAQLAAGATYERRNHGFDGNVHVGYTSALVNSSTPPLILQTWKNAGLPHNPDLNSGNVRGFSMGPQTLDRDQGKRWDSATAYYHPVESRKNLRIVKGTVKRITWADKKRRLSKHDDERIVANGVDYVTEDGKTHTLRIRREIIVSAGGPRTPLILEGSGIGNPRILKSLGIKTKVSLPGVGENLLEQPNHTLLFQQTSLETSWSAYHTFVTMSDLFGSRLPSIKASTRASIPRWARATKLLELQHDLLFEKNVTAGEIISVVAPGIVASNFWILMPFSRGSVHLGDKNKIDEPAIDPRLFLADFDLEAQVALGRFARKFWTSEPVRRFVGEPVQSEGFPLEEGSSDEQWRAFVRGTGGPNAHLVGTAAMMSRELGGVVDPELRVYGTANVRVVDASVLPTQFSGHLTATLYALSERAADIIKRTS